MGNRPARLPTHTGLWSFTGLHRQTRGALTWSLPSTHVSLAVSLSTEHQWEGGSQLCHTQPLPAQPSLMTAFPDRPEFPEGRRALLLS